MPPGITSTSRPALTEVDRIVRVVVKHPREAFGGPAVIEAEWRDLGFTAPPDLARAIEEYDRFLALIGQSGAEILSLPKGEGVGLDSLYTRDASIVCDRGVILCAMGKPLRAGEPSAQAVAFRDVGHSHRRPHRTAWHARRRRRRLARCAHDRRGPRLPHERRRHPAASCPARRLDRRADRGATAPLARAWRRLSPDVDHQPCRRRPGRGLLAAHARAVPRAAPRTRLASWWTYPTRSSIRWAPTCWRLRHDTP